LSLSLAYNCIGDAGTKSLAGVSDLISMIILEIDYFRMNPHNSANDEAEGR